MPFDVIGEGYLLALAALVVVFVYFILVAAVVNVRASRPVVPCYEPPPGASPAVASWLFEPSQVSRSMACALVNMASKGYVEIRQTSDLFSVIQVATETSASLEPEEDALVRFLFSDYDTFEFAQFTPQLAKAIEAFRWALVDTGYFSSNTGLFIPGAMLSSVATILALLRGHSFSGSSNRPMAIVTLLTVGASVMAVRTLPRTIAKIGARLPWSVRPRRPWVGADSRPILFLLIALCGLCVVGLMSSPIAALISGGFLVINVIFFAVLQGNTPTGRRVLAQLEGYRKFLSEVDRDVISRANSSDDVPSHLSAKEAYAIAFGIDLGWGEQFVSCIADIVEFADVFGNKSESTS